MIWLRAVRRISIPAAHRSCDISSGSILSSSKIISIPAAHRSCDSRTSCRTRTTPDFNPRSSQELRRSAISSGLSALGFQSPQLTGAATVCPVRCTAAPSHFNPRSSQELRRHRWKCMFNADDFNPRSSQELRPMESVGSVCDVGFQSPQLTGAATAYGYYFRRSHIISIPAARRSCDSATTRT